MAECIKCGAYTKYPNGHCYSCYTTLKYSKNNISIKDYLPSEGEEFVKEFFKEYSIKYQTEKEINGLKNDNSNKRIADFYLPQYKVYVEFLGQWNIDNERKRYIEKMEVYSINQVPCIFIYPENLGILSHIFDKRLQKILHKHELYAELNKYKRFKFLRATLQNYLFSFITLILLYISNLDKPDITWNLVLITIIIFQVIYITTKYFKIYKLNEFTLDKTKL